MISSIPLTATTSVPNVLVSRSTNVGMRWGNPVTIPQPVGVPVDLDKNWTACDNSPVSPFYGNCYTEFDNFAQGDVVYMSTSTDGGLTVGTPKTMRSKYIVIGSHQVVQPNGKVICPIEGFSPPRIISFMPSEWGV